MPGPAAVVGDMHICPMVTGTVPHVGGSITGPGAPNILHNGKPAAVVGDLCTCVGPPDTIVQGHPAIFHNGKQAVCQGDMTAHGGMIAQGLPNIIHGFVTEPMKPYTTPVSEIPFPKISLTNKLLGNAKEAMANQEALKEVEQKDITVSNLQWKKDNKQISETFLGTEVEVYAKVNGVDVQNGAFLPFRIYEKDGQGEDDFVTSVMGKIENNKIIIPWETIYMEDKDDIESAQELQAKEYTLPEYVVKYDNLNGETVESNLLVIKDQLELEVIDEETGEPLSETNFTIALPNGEMINGELDANGYALVENLSSSMKYQIVFHKEDHIITVAKY